MLLKMQVGHWHTGVAVKMDADGLKWLDGLGNGRRIKVSVTDDRMVIVSSDAEGHKVHMHDAKRASDYPYASSYNHVDVDISRFELLELTFFGGDTPHVLGARLPPDHQLPWPKFLSGTIQAFDPQELVVTELLRRMTSKLRAERRSGCAQAWERPPEGLRALLPKGVTWKDLMDRAAIAASA